MTRGRLIAVVGPSGVGKDSVMRGLVDVLPNARLVRRVITRAADLGGEDYESVTPDVFQQRAARGDFAVHWQAHELFYGIPATVHAELEKGRDCLANFSRKALVEAAAHFEPFIVLNITARPDTLAARLAARGRESREQIAKRLAEAEKPLPTGVTSVTISNDGALSQAIDDAAQALRQKTAMI